MNEFRYRPDVDGLRAVAVGMVLLFHARLGFPGGYVGVDVFFVISGFLITGLILKEQKAGTFSLANFWVRRIRRIVPASTAMVVVVLVAGGFLLIPGDYESLGKSTIWQQLMSSNVYFRKNIGYFCGPADLKPLLHTWSLAVEEQFYLIYPFLLVFLRRFPKWQTVSLLAGISMVSFAISLWEVEWHHPDAAFFLLPARAWELLVGGLIHFAPAPNRLKSWHLGLLSWLAMGGIVIAGLCFSGSTPFPGAAALLPCGSTTLLIYANSPRLTKVGRFLAAKPIVFIGLLSYSLYLWHWPILAFLRYRYGEKLGISVSIIALLVSFTLAYLSWRFIETPFRSRMIFRSNIRLFSSAIASAIILLVASSLVDWTDGLSGRYSKETKRIFSTMKERKFLHEVSVADVLGGKLPAFGASNRIPRILVWGDSHAMELVPAFDEVCKQRGIGGVQATHSGWPPLLNFRNSREWTANEDFGDAVVNYEEFGDAVVSYIVQNRIEVVVLAGYWRGHDGTLLQGLNQAVKALLSRGVSIVIFRDTPVQKTSPREQIMSALRHGAGLRKLGVNLHEHRRTQARADAVLASLERDGVLVVDSAPYLTDADGRCPLVLNGESIYRDAGHISVAGARRLKPMCELALDKLGLELKDNSISQSNEANRQ